MDSRTSPKRGLAVASIVIAAAMTAACSSQSSNPSVSATACPVTPLNVTVTTNVWGSVVDQLAGPCAQVTTLLTSQTADPHDFEPSAATSATVAASQVLVMNGLGYDAWATKIVDSLGSQQPTVLDLGTTVGLTIGANPHIWYSPEYVAQSAAAVTALLKQKLPSAAAQFDGAADAFNNALGPYRDQINAIKSRFSGTNIGATESVFDYLAQATGLVITTPDAFRLATAKGTDPTAQSIATFRTQLINGTDKVLIFNTQTAGELPEQLRQVANQANVPIVNVTETLTPQNATFQDWQSRQLQALWSALVSAGASTPATKVQ